MHSILKPQTVRTSLLAVGVLLLGLNALLLMERHDPPQAHAQGTVNAAEQRKAIHQELVGLRKDVKDLKTTLTSGKIKVDTDH